MQDFVKKWKSLNKGPKILSLGIFGLEFEKNIAIFEKSSSFKLSCCKVWYKNKTL